MRSLIVATLPLVACGCATIIEGTSQNLSVTTQPPGATCVLERDGKRLGSLSSTPGVIKVPRAGGDLKTICNAGGYDAETQVQQAHFTGVTLLNLLLGGLIGVLVDAGSGANYGYDNVNLTLHIAPSLPLGAPPPVTSTPSGVMPTIGPDPDPTSRFRS